MVTTLNSERAEKVIVAKEFLARRGANPVLFTVGSEIAFATGALGETLTFTALGESEIYAVDRQILEQSTRSAGC